MKNNALAIAVRAGLEKWIGAASRGGMSGCLRGKQTEEAAPKLDDRALYE